MDGVPEEGGGAARGVGARARAAWASAAARARRRRGGAPSSKGAHHPEPRVVHVPMTDTLRERVRDRHNYRGNRTTTTKYNALTFLPKALFEQYR
jgi:hypothetical protein